MSVEEPIQSRLVPYFGCDSGVAEAVGEELAGCRWVGIPFSGSLAALRCIAAPSIVASDLHRHVVNLCRVVACDSARRDMFRWLKRQPFHPQELDRCQRYCRVREPEGVLDVEAAGRYFVTQWMGRSGNAGTDREFTGNVSIRWNGNGGDSNKRYRSAIRSLAVWGRIMRRCNFEVCDTFEFLAKVQDDAKNGLYIDAPWPDDGAEYCHKFTEPDQRRLHSVLAKFVNCRVVVRYGDHPLIRELYSEWTWRGLTSRNQGNNEVDEFLILNGPLMSTGIASAARQPVMFA